jgi:uncharacterized membrane protein YGL010W
VTSRAERLFDDYASAHRTPGNRLCHSVGIPLIVFSSILALATVPLGRGLTAAEPVIVLVSIAEFALDPVPAAVFVVFSAGCDAAGRMVAGAFGTIPALVFAGTLFVVGWIFQLVGHAVFEKNRPAFARNLRHMLIGPLWISRKAIGRGSR